MWATVIKAVSPHTLEAQLVGSLITAIGGGGGGGVGGVGGRQRVYQFVGAQPINHSKQDMLTEAGQHRNGGN